MSGGFGPPLALSDLVRAALSEDVGSGDVTTRATVPADLPGRARVIARARGVVAGTQAFVEVYRQVDPSVEVDLVAPDGTPVEPGDLVAGARGAFVSLLAAERVALNFLQRLSGIATLASKFVRAIEGTGATVVDTRKTTPGWRALEKAAVRAGGAANHRMGLYDAYLIKENHVAGAGGIAAALAAARRHDAPGLPVEIEVRSLEELDEALGSRDRPDRILCDNFSLEDLARAVERVRSAPHPPLVEASGGITLANARAVAATGVDWISVGGLTHSAPALDLSCLIEPA
ncbi:MAG TPA: carboxylating nicotinate-nucleotide diphosphorylase [Gemmatimonadota bacterium]|nr:carboxylating nicotinate-nucleotide diphosphorylase [Gemmatimonadota bacterium]